jgi:hypothetical protein
MKTDEECESLLEALPALKARDTEREKRGQDQKDDSKKHNPINEPDSRAHVIGRVLEWAPGAQQDSGINHRRAQHNESFKSFVHAGGRSGKVR